MLMKMTWDELQSLPHRQKAARFFNKEITMMKDRASFKTPVLLTKALLIGVLVAGCDKTSDVASAPDTVAQTPAAQIPAARKEKVELMHVHGLAYSPDGKKILIPSHHGLAVFDGSAWSKAAGPQHDYMGFSATKDAIYSSGHPAPDAGLVNPFGVIKSTDGGQSWKKLGLEGESDFHVLATGYGTNAVYVVNFQPNSKMQQQGIYTTLNDGFSWQRAKAQGLQGSPAALAAHPFNAKVVAVGTDKGLYLSQDAGDTFQKIDAGEVLALFFDLNEKHLWVSTTDGQPGLARVDFGSKQASKINLPVMQKDAVAYIAQNPRRKNEYAIATFQRSVYISQDDGKTWKQIAENGSTR